MGVLGYNLVEYSHIKSSKVLEAPCYPFSTDVRGIDTMLHSTLQPTALKVCLTCGQSKLLDQFPSTTKRGRKCLRAHCRDCHNANRREQRANDPEYLKQHREYEALRRQKNPEHFIEIDRARYLRDTDKRCESAKKARQSNPLRERAHGVVRLAVDRGDLPPAWSMVCDVCKEAQAVDWHHHSYEEEYQLDVIAVCSPCHGKEHRIVGGG